MAALLKPAQQEMGSPQLLVPADAVWYPLHGNTTPAGATHPALDFATGATGNWSTQGYYSFPVPNTTDAANSDNSLSLDAVLSMVGMEAGNQWIIAHEMRVPNHSGTGFIWCYGQDGGQSHLNLAMVSTEKLQIAVRGYNGTGVSHQYTTMTALSTSAAVTTVVVSIEAASGTEFVARILTRGTGDGAWQDLGYSVSLDALGGGTANQGRNSVNHAGLTFGARPTSAWTPAGKASIANYANFFGNGSGSARMGNFVARKFATTDLTRPDAVAADLWAKPREFPESLL